MFDKHRILWRRTLLGVALLCCGDPAGAQAPIPDGAIVGELRTLASHAGSVFVGRITSIQRRTGCVEVTFQVEQPVSGATGSTFVLREWAGLWAPGQGRYAIGQRVLAFVHGAGAAGFSSPVHGPEGLVPVLVQGANAPELLDIRRVAASVLRSSGTPLPTERDGAIPLTEALASLTQAGLPNSSKVSRQSLPLRAHPPAAMQPGHGAPGLVFRPVGVAETPTRVTFSTGRQTDAKR